MRGLYLKTRHERVHPILCSQFAVCIVLIRLTAKQLVQR
jgi:hypothetical protein